MKIRDAKPDDVEALLPLAADLATSFAVDPQAFRTSFAGCLREASSLVLVAEDSAGLAGYLLGSDHYAFFANGRVANVEEIYVSPANRQQGIGRKLMRRFEKWAIARGAVQATVCTRRASAFYAALGYEETAVCFRTALKGMAEQDLPADAEDGAAEG
jgi:ribosomal protein S18 acetylase RimI-like enzyme